MQSLLTGFDRFPSMLPDSIAVIKVQAFIMAAPKSSGAKQL
jgi:hypothetical protein